jgi:hypothetical protein
MAAVEDNDMSFYSEGEDESFVFEDDVENVAPAAKFAGSKPASKSLKKGSNPILSPRSKNASNVLADANAGGTGANKKKSKTIEETYQKKSQLEHILLRPDTYIGSVEPLTEPMFIYDEEQDAIVNKTITFTPGLFKIFDESKCEI